MQSIRTTYTKSLRCITAALLLLFGVHFLSIHGFADTLVLCFEENGDVNIESAAGSFLSIPSEDILHAEASHNHSQPTLTPLHSNHADISLSVACSKEQTTRFNQERALQYLDGILNTNVEELPRSRIFQLVSFSLPLIEDIIITSLQTVVLIN